MSSNPPFGYYTGPRDQVASPPVRVGKEFDPAARVGAPNVVCLHPDCVEALAAAIERRLLTSKGIAVRLSTACQQPFSSRDLDVITTNQLLADALGSVVVIATTTATGERQMVKGFGFVAAITGAASFDPLLYVRLRLVKNGQPLPPYQNIVAPISNGLTGLAACTVDLRDGDTLQLVGERYAAGAPGGIVLSGRLKGWSYTPTADGDRVDGAIAY